MTMRQIITDLHHELVWPMDLLPNLMENARLNLAGVITLDEEIQFKSGSCAADLKRAMRDDIQQAISAGNGKESEAH